jgi:transcription elongation factor GreA
MNKLYKLTQEGVKELKAELTRLISERPEVIEKIKAARELGDLSENAEYATAKDEQSRTESRITEIEYILKNVDLIKSPKNDSKVVLGSRVALKGVNGEKSFQVVGTVEADPLQGKISDESPIGQALIGKVVGDTVEIVTPNETLKYSVVTIS